MIEDAIYDGSRVFLIIRGDRADTGDDHVLFSEDGKEICRFGGYVPRVTAGACDVEKIIHIKNLYPANVQ